MNPCTTVTKCRTCGEPFDAERPQSMGNPSACVPCATGHALPPKGEAVSARKSVAGGSLALDPYPEGRWTHRRYRCVDGFCGALDCSRCHP